jgi:thymidylate synthase (FAD)
MKVELVSKTHGVGKYEGLTSEQIVAAVARHGVIKEDNGKLVKYLMDNAHWSPLDMINFTFEIETSRDIGRQILRHQSIKFQEHSTRYSDRVQFEPIELRLEDKINRQSSTKVVGTLTIGEKNWSIREIDGFEEYGDFLEEFAGPLRAIENLYKRGLEKGIAKECMRKILPGCLTTTMSANGTLRSWLAFLNVRCDHHSEKEIQIIATEIGELLEKEMPGVFSTIDWRKGMFM